MKKMRLEKKKIEKMLGGSKIFSYLCKRNMQLLLT